jgi:hypothetical protein
MTDKQDDEQEAPNGNHVANLTQQVARIMFTPDVSPSNFAATFACLIGGAVSHFWLEGDERTRFRTELLGMVCLGFDFANQEDDEERS